MLENLDFDKIDKQVIDALIGTPESRYLDFKRELPGGKDADRKEFAADVSAFANAGGGFIVFGVTEEGGVAKDVHGLAIKDSDKEILRLHDMLRSGIDPKVPGIRIEARPGFQLGPVVLLRVPRSWIAPHMVVAAGADSRFFARSGGRKEPLDVRQIRAAFALSQELPDRIRRFRDERLGRIVSDEIPVPLASKRRVVVHLIPISSMDPGVVRDIAPAAAAIREKFRPIDGNGPNRFNIDGFLTWSTHPRTNDPSGYVQVFRNGTIEIVDGQSVSPVNGVPTLASVAFPKSLVRALSHYMDGLKELEIDPPIMALISMTGAKGVEIFVGPQSAYASQVVPIDRDTLLLPDVLFESYVTSSFLGLSSDTMETRLRPVFDALWQACGMPQFFDDDRRRR